MSNSESHIPDGYTAVTPYLLNTDAPRVIDFLVSVFGAAVNGKTEDPSGRLVHADLTIGDAHVMIGNSTNEWPPNPGSNYLYVDDVDEVFARALDAGARSLMEPSDKDYGDRQGGISDPGGNVWWIATPIAHLRTRRSRA
jgi:PhnB protein